MGKRELPRLILISHMIIAKHRKGSTGDVLLNFRGPVELDDEEDD